MSEKVRNPFPDSPFYYNNFGRVSTGIDKRGVIYTQDIRKPGEYSFASLSLPLRDIPDTDLVIPHFTLEDYDLWVQDELGQHLAGVIKKEINPDVVVGMPNGHVLAHIVARFLGHSRVVDISNTPSTFQDERYQVFHDQSISGSRIPFRIDQDRVAELEGRHAVLVDDVLYTAKSVRTAQDLLENSIGVEKVSVATIVTQGNAWVDTFEDAGFDWKQNMVTLGNLPMFERITDGLVELV